MAAAIAAAEARTIAAMEAFAGRNEMDRRARGPKYSGHFAGLVLIRADAQKEPERRGSRVDRQAIEAMLADRAAAVGREVRRGCDVKGLVRQADGVDVEWVSATGEGHIGCSYLVGCDGGRGPVRKMAGFDFPGCRCVGVDEGPSMLIRPDACVAWAGDDQEWEELTAALRRWFVPAPGERDTAEPERPRPRQFPGDGERRTRRVDAV